MLPAAVINDELQRKVQKIAEEEGRKVGGRERKRIKEDLLTELLPRAFVRNSRMSAYVDRKNGWLVLDTSSRKSAENALTQIREALGSFPAVPLAPEEGPRVLMTDWLANGNLPAGLALGDEVRAARPGQRHRRHRQVPPAGSRRRGGQGAPAQRQAGVPARPGVRRPHQLRAGRGPDRAQAEVPRRGAGRNGRQPAGRRTPRRMPASPCSRWSWSGCWASWRSGSACRGRRIAERQRRSARRSGAPYWTSGRLRATRTPTVQKQSEAATGRRMAQHLEGDWLELATAGGSTIRVLKAAHPRARRLRLTVTPKGRARVLSARHPSGPGQRVPAQSRRLAGAEARRAATCWSSRCPRCGWAMPAEFPLRGEAVGLDWAEGPYPRIETRADGLTLVIPRPHTRALPVARGLLASHLEALIRRDVSRWLAGYVPQLGLAPTALRIRPMKSLWGSLDTRDRINLDLALALAPPAALRYVLAHELCHLKVRNHSPRFWAQVENLFPALARAARLAAPERRDAEGRAGSAGGRRGRLAQRRAAAVSGPVAAARRLPARSCRTVWPSWRLVDIAGEARTGRCRTAPGRAGLRASNMSIAGMALSPRRCMSTMAASKGSLSMSNWAFSSVGLVSTVMPMSTSTSSTIIATTGSSSITRMRFGEVCGMGGGDRWVGRRERHSGTLSGRID